MQLDAVAESFHTPDKTAGGGATRLGPLWQRHSLTTSRAAASRVVSSAASLGRAGPFD